MPHIKEVRRRIAVVGLPMFQSVDNLGSSAVANYAERRGNWQFVFAAEATVKAVRFLRTIDCDGAIVRILSPAMRREAQMVRVPLINVSSWLDDPGVPTVRHDYRSCGYMAAAYLLGKGYRRFGCVMTPGACVPKRAERFLQAVAAHGLKPAIFQLHSPKPFLRLPLSAAEKKRFTAWIQSFEPPAALVLMDDWDAPALMRICQTAGFEIPRDIVVLSIGIHNETLAACPVQLTAVQEDHEAQMKRVVDDLELIMAGKKRGKCIVEIPPIGIVERTSTIALAINDRVVVRAIDHIRGHLADGVHISRVAEGLQVSRATLDRRFLEQTGETPHNILKKERIRLARDLLEAGSPMTLNAIARLCGFSDRRRLNLVFKKATGLLPTEWRARAPMK
jgi:LacI family transcriptional regulator